MSQRARADALQGTRAGFVSRVTAAVIDVIVVFLALLGGEAMFAAVRAVFGDEPFEFPDVGALESSGLLIGVLVIVLTLTWSGSGRTLGDGIVGLRVVREDGRRLTWARAAVRAVIVVSFHVLAMGWILVSKKNAGIHDLACRTAVVYDWHPRQRHDRAARTPARSESRQTQ